MAPHPELAAEQAYVDRAYQRLDAMRALAAERMSAVMDQSLSSTPSDKTDRDVIVQTSLQRLEQLQIGDQPICFGRIDDKEEETFYIGRLAVSDETQEPLVVDWRAPIAEPFYRATPLETMGLVRRRHFQTRGRRVTDIEDEDFNSVGEGPQTNAPQTLFVALEQRRTGTMRDIAATIQKEQDDIIRGPLSGVLVVQGGPGTGKTAVALHRAAYLLYTHRFPLERQGVLIVGPNPIFMRYISQVLPSLGETGVTMASVADLFTGADVRGTDSLAADRLKGDARMARVIQRAIRDRERGLRKDLEVPYGRRFLRISAGRTKQLVVSAKKRRGTHNGRRRHLSMLLAAELRIQIQNGADDTLFGANAEHLVHQNDPDIKEFWQEIREEPVFIDALNRMWPKLSPTELLHDLFGAPALIESACHGILKANEGKLLSRTRSSSFDEIPWTVADIALLDEARVWLGVRKKGAADPDDRAFGHIVVDEAQDLSPMQLRMIQRRSISSSMTVVGDLGQASGSWVPNSWQDVISKLDHDHEGKVVELSVNYRTPKEVMDIAAAVLREASPQLVPPQSIRETGTQPKVLRVDRSMLLSTARDTVSNAQVSVPGAFIGVVVPHALVEHAEAEIAPDTEYVNVYTLEAAKGLEFDVVVVIEPQQLVDEAAHGLSALYVALTRTTNELTVIHAQDLPKSMASAISSSQGQSS